MKRKNALKGRANSENKTTLQLVIDAVKASGGNMTAAGRNLGVSATTIRHHLRKAGLTVHSVSVAVLEAQL